MQTAININLKAMAISLMRLRFSFLIGESKPDIAYIYSKSISNFTPPINHELNQPLQLGNSGFYERFYALGE